MAGATRDASATAQPHLLVLLRLAGATLSASASLVGILEANEHHKAAGVVPSL